MTAIPVLSLHQPWAQLIVMINPATGKPYKQVETRSWPAPKWLIGKRIAVHAAKTSNALDYLMWEWEHIGDIPEVLEPFPIGTLTANYTPRGKVTAVHSMPLGAIIATARLADCVPMVGEDSDERPILHIKSGDGGTALWLWERNRPGWPYEEASNWKAELPYGWYEPGRWAWILSDVTPLAAPVPFKGQQGLSARWDPDA